jgi:hypothetical protein
MDGVSRRPVPPVERSFVSSRLAEDLLSSVYERLLGTAGRRERLPVRNRSGDACDGWNEKAEQEALGTLATGGRS